MCSMIDSQCDFIGCASSLIPNYYFFCKFIEVIMSLAGLKMK